MSKDKLYSIWEGRDPKWEEKFYELIKQYTDYGIGAGKGAEDKAKKLGAGYEMYIYAFFIGLYLDKRRPLSGDTKRFGHQILYWDGKDVIVTERKKYPRLKEYIFASLIARTDDLDFIALERGKIVPSRIVDALINTMEEYANYGLYLVEEKLLENPAYFDTNTGFLDFLLSTVNINKKEHEQVLEKL